MDYISDNLLIALGEYQPDHRIKKEDRQQNGNITIIDCYELCFTLAFSVDLSTGMTSCAAFLIA
jgi:hypothetical protein